MVELVERGYLYIAQPPLYKIKRGKKEQYLRNEAALQNYLLEEGTEEMVLEMGGTDKTYRGKQIIPLLRQMIEHDALFAKVTKKGINEGLLKLLLDCGVKNGFEEIRDIEPYLVRMKEASPGSDYLLVDNHVTFMVGNVRTRIDHHTLELLNSHEYGVLMESHGKVREIMGDGRAVVSVEGKQLLETASHETLLSFFMETAKKGLYIQRYKGLGEMNPEQLWETTMNPDNRVLLQVKIEDVVEAEEIFTVLMGDQVEPRREFIENNALNVSNLDI
jgi:DNA gyrase subunit B